MSTSAESALGIITPLQTADFEAWQQLFRAYVAFYNSSIPDAQYRETFNRLTTPAGDLHGLGLRRDGSLVGIAHFYSHQTPWSEGRIMYLNDLFIDPKFRGNGYGRKMIEEVASQAKQMGCFRLEWATQHGNPARKLYDELAVCDFVEYRMKLE